MKAQSGHPIALLFHAFPSFFAPHVAEIGALESTHAFQWKR